MSVGERFDLVKGLWDLAVALAPDKFPYAAQESGRHAHKHDTDLGTT